MNNIEIFLNLGTYLVLGESWMDKPTDFGVPMGVLFLLAFMGMMFGNANRQKQQIDHQQQQIAEFRKTQRECMICEKVIPVKKLGQQMEISSLSLRARRVTCSLNCRLEYAARLRREREGKNKRTKKTNHFTIRDLVGGVGPIIRRGCARFARRARA